MTPDPADSAGARGADAGAAQATRREIADGARRHYDELSTAACHWMSTIPHAIDAWEREPELLAVVVAAMEAQDAAKLHHGLWAIPHAQAVRFFDALNAWRYPGRAVTMISRAAEAPTP